LKKRISPEKIIFLPFSNDECHEKCCGTCSVTRPFRLNYREYRGKPNRETDPRYCQELLLAMKMASALDQFDFQYTPDLPWSEEWYIKAIFDRAKNPGEGFYLSPIPDGEIKNKMEQLADRLWEASKVALLPYLEHQQLNIWERRRLLSLAWIHSKYAPELWLPAYASSSGKVSDGRHRSCVSKKTGIPYIYVRLV